MPPCGRHSPTPVGPAAPRHADAQRSPAARGRYAGQVGRRPPAYPWGRRRRVPEAVRRYPVPQAVHQFDQPACPRCRRRLYREQTPRGNQLGGAPGALGSLGRRCPLGRCAGGYRVSGPTPVAVPSPPREQAPACRPGCHRPSEGHGVLSRCFRTGPWARERDHCCGSWAWPLPCPCPHPAFRLRSRHPALRRRALRTRYAADHRTLFPRAALTQVPDDRDHQETPRCEQ